MTRRPQPAGTIALELAVDDGWMRISMGDDGRGLALERIRKIGVDKGLVAPDMRLFDEEAATLIFRPGFSTADRVTDISGRGVGMDAVQDFVRREGGKIEIQFADEAWPCRAGPPPFRGRDRRNCGTDA